jgi:Fe2+ or Zn2+ uptake regulation protein
VTKSTDVGVCYFCGRLLDVRDADVYRSVTCWVTSGIVDKATITETKRFAHRRCIDVHDIGSRVV